MNIRLLPETLVNQIAAGEVIERPFSVVRELVENAIDADASHISIALRDGGKTHIRIDDNGCGMTKDDLSLCVDRHATSKLPDDDLVHIASLGFRGEALPSIGSIARLTITSRARDCDDAWQIKVEGGKKEAIKPAARKTGTTIDVSDIFYATPARLKFLKSSGAETRAVKDVILRLAMAYPAVGFTFTVDGKEKLSLPAMMQENFLDARLGRLAAIMGREFETGAMPIDARNGGVHLFGFAGLPTMHKPTAQHQYLFVNGRPVQDKLFKGALRGAYHDVIESSRHPVVSLFLDMPPEEVDMNVHPAKSEVRFRDTGMVRGLIVGSIKNILAEHGHRSAPSVSHAALGAFQAPAPALNHTPMPLRGRGGHYAAHQQAGFHDSASAFQSGFAPAARMESLETGTVSNMNTQEGMADFPLGAARAQLFQNYIVAEAEDGLVLVDQHAAHERLTYERIKAELAEKGVARQGMLIPEIIDMDSDAIDTLMHHADNLKKLGLALSRFGNGSVSVEEVPALLGNRIDWQAMIRDLADTLSDIDNTQDILQEKLWAVCSRIACHGSIRSGRQLDATQMNALLRAMENEALSGQCNHGRPTYIKLSLKDIERLFGRS